MSSLYLDHFRLTEVPFGITPNGKFFFDGQARGAILEALHHAVLDDDGITVVVGEVGSGKTMLCRMLAQRLTDAQVDLVFLANPSFGPREILQSIAADWGLVVPPEQSLLLAIQNALMQRHEQGRRVVVLIDEAQTMQAESLDEVKLLSNLETEQRKLLQIVLFGQPELDDLLALPRLRQVRDRVVHRFELQPFNAADARAYVDHRLRLAGWRGGEVFEAAALKRLIAASGGRLRAIHLLADKALLAAFAAGVPQVGTAHVKAACAELQPLAISAIASRDEQGGGRARSTAWLLGLGGVALGVVLAWGLGLLSRPLASLPAAATPAVPASSGQTVGTAPVAAPIGPAASMVAPSAETPPATSEPAPTAATAMDGASASAAVPVPIAPAAPLAPQPPALRTSPVAPTPAPTNVVAETAVAAKGASDDAVALRYAALAPALREQVLRSRAWLDDPAQEGWVIQLGLSHSATAAQAVCAQVAALGPCWVHDRKYEGKIAQWTVYTGQFAQRTLAQQAVGRLPPALSAQRPLIRSLAAIRSEPYPDVPPP